MADYSELVKRLRYAGDRAAFEPHMHHEAADAIEALQRAVLAAEARALERAMRLCSDQFDAHVTGAIYGLPENARPREAAANMAERLKYEIRALITDEMRKALEQEQGNV